MISNKKLLIKHLILQLIEIKNMNITLHKIMLLEFLVNLFIFLKFLILKKKIFLTYL